MQTSAQSRRRRGRPSLPHPIAAAWRRCESCRSLFDRSEEAFAVELVDGDEVLTLAGGGTWRCPQCREAGRSRA